MPNNKGVYYLLQMCEDNHFSLDAPHPLTPHNSLIQAYVSDSQLTGKIIVYLVLCSRPESATIILYAIVYMFSNLYF